GLTGADLSNVINEAAILAARARKPLIEMKHLLEALDRTIAGPARNARRFSEQERKTIAYHEAGHAVVAHLLPHCDPVRKVSIVSRGKAGGFTMIVPEEDRGLWTRQQLIHRLAALLAGMAAEEIVNGDVTTGSSNDLEQATSIASSMVQRYGMSKRFGLLSIGGQASDLGPLSPQTAFTAEQETLELVRTAHQMALDVLHAHRDDLEAVAQRLLEVETIEGDELAGMIGPLRPLPVRPAPKPVDQDPTPPPTLHQQPRSRRGRRLGRAVAAVAAFALGHASGEVMRPPKPEADKA
ncbi:MAG: cell division protein FtsH, partial [Thermomicrobiaceae bacterium]|nr:cell division protein FtsH [Thermomicrobiaceae bacterium]